MPQKITGWEGLCFIPGEGIRDEQGRQTVMTTHAQKNRDTPEEAWQDAIALGKQHSSEFLGIRPITEEDRPSRPRRIMTIAIYSNVEEEVRE
jgi:hypothetical protein